MGKPIPIIKVSAICGHFFSSFCTKKNFRQIAQKVPALSLTLRCERNFNYLDLCQFFEPKGTKASELVYFPKPVVCYRKSRNFCQITYTQFFCSIQRLIASLYIFPKISISSSSFSPYFLSFSFLYFIFPQNPSFAP